MPQDDWFDNSGSKPVKSSDKKEKKPVQKEKKDEFDFDFGGQPSKKSSKPSSDFFGFDDNPKPQPEATDNAFDAFEQPDLIQPDKPKFEDYFPEGNDSDNDAEQDSGLISNLKKLYQKDGVLPENNKQEDILQPEILQPKKEFTPEVKLQGADFWEERKNPHLSYQQKPNYHHLSVLGAPGASGGHLSPGGFPSHPMGGPLHISKSSNALVPPSEFPSQPNMPLNIHRSHSSDSSAAKKADKNSGVFGDLYQTSMEQVQK